MKLMHLADLHIGKRLKQYSLIEDQKVILNQILELAEKEQPDAVLIAGDVYDKTVPSEDAVELLDDFLVGLSKLNTRIMVIYGNHDSADRLTYARRLLDSRGIAFCPVYNGEIEPLYLEDSYGKVAFWLIPFLKPTHIRHYHAEWNTESYESAMQSLIENLSVDESIRNVALVHQFITGAAVCESEESMVGGTENISAEVFKPFDYIALGHLHGPQHIGRDTVRYAGSPLKYSFSEVNQKKSVTIVEMGEKGTVEVREVPLKPLRDLRILRGTFMELMNDVECSEDYIKIVLTDEQDIPEGMPRMQQRFPNIAEFGYDNTRTRAMFEAKDAPVVENKSPLELFDEFYKRMNGHGLDDAQRSYLIGLLEKLGEDEA